MKATHFSILGRTMFSLLILATLPILLVTVAAAQKGSITGRVITDEGAGLPGITLTIQAYSDGSPSAPGSRAKAATTDAEGNFQFTNLEPRAYSIYVQSGRGYVQETPFDPGKRTLYRLGEQATIRMLKGGVITGRVTNASDEPMIGVNVMAIRIRDAEGNKTDVSTGGRNRRTDDRGIFRLYSLPPGTYVVVANLGSQNFREMSAYGDLSPTYHLSSTQDTAIQLTVVNGAELTSVDIRHRGDRGFAVSGKVIGGNIRSSTFIPVSTILLSSVPSGGRAGQAYASRLDNESGFAMYGVADGDYEIVASSSGSNPEDNFRSEPRRISVRGADVTGIELRLTAMASISGRITLEPATNACTPPTKSVVEETVITVRREEKPLLTASVSPTFLPTIAANETGEFKLNSIPPGRYRLALNPPNENWFVKSISSSSSSPTPAVAGKSAPTPTAKTDFARLGMALKVGEQLTGVAVTLTEGAASLRGKVTAKAGGKLPAHLRVHLIPAEATAAPSTDDVLRYGEVLTSDGSFAFTNFAPGKYWLLARAVAESEPADRLPSPVAWDAAERRKLRKEAEAAKTEIELKACQRVKDFVLRF
ncbi:MAG: carboxypeptidase regulatory-like domain-containing protein [Blastocatellia bacterium]